VPQGGDFETEQEAEPAMMPQQARAFLACPFSSNVDTLSQKRTSHIHIRDIA